MLNRIPFRNLFLNRTLQCTRKHSFSISSKSEWEGVVGLEVHAQISSTSKLFSGAATDFGSAINSNVSLFDAAIPGTLPVLNRRCVEAGVLTALALSCRINTVSLFDRKHYFYADLPAGYQITQQRRPLAVNGELSFEVLSMEKEEKFYSKKSHVIQLQLEQDSGKSLHDINNQRSLVDLNRAGVGLMEIVFSPDICCGEEAAALIKELSLILQCLKTCSCRMEEGALRVDANVSIRPRGSSLLGARSELKNLGSIRSVVQAINYEIKRQVEVMEQGGKVGGDTRSWDADLKVTLPMRDKEILQDYRFMPEPNLPPLRLNDGDEEDDNPGVDNPDWPPPVSIVALKKQIPQLPSETRLKLRKEFGLPVEASIILVNEPILLSHFLIIQHSNQQRDPKMIANVLINELLTLLNKAEITLENCKITSSTIGEVVDLLQSKTVNHLICRKVLQIILDGSERSPIKIVEDNDWCQITDTLQIKKICNDVIEANPKLVKQYRSGKVKVFGAILGEVAKVTKQKVNMAAATDILKEILRKN